MQLISLTAGFHKTNIMQIIERTETRFAKRHVIYEGLSVANQTAIVTFLRTFLFIFMIRLGI